MWYSRSALRLGLGVSMRCVGMLLLIGLGCVIAASADALPSLVWDGDPTVQANGGEQVDSYGTTTGMEMGGACYAPDNQCFLNFDVQRNFTVTSPGTFVLTGSVYNDVESYDCDPGGCPSPSYAELYPGTSFDVSPVGFGFSFSGSGVAGPVYASYTPYDCCGSEVTLDMTDTRTELLTLDVGNYTLGEAYNGSAFGSGDTQIVFSGDFSLVPTPEPIGDIPMLAAAMLIALGLRSRPRAA
jgi:hypothetical protein